MSAEDIEYMDDYKYFPTKESALDWLDYYLSLDERNNLIRALEQEPCEDAISRNELLKAIDTWDKFGCDANTKLVPYQDHYIPYIHYDDVIKCIKGMPPVAPQTKMGHWIELGYVGNDNYDFECSECHHTDTHSKTVKVNYCWCCGTKMEVEE